MTRRLLTALLACIAVGAALPAAAAADVFIAFTALPDAPGRVDAFDFEDEAPLALSVARGGAVIAKGTGTLEVPRLEPGDVATANGVSAVFSALTFSGVCVGSTSFTVSRPAASFLLDAGAGTLDDPGAPIEATTSEDSPAVVTLSRPLAAGEAAFATALGPIDGGMVGVMQAVPAKACAQAPQTPSSPSEPGTPRSAPIAPLSGTSAAARLKRLGLARLARVRTLALPFAFTQPGRVQLKLVARGTVIGTGAKTAGSGEHRVRVKLTAAGRRLLRRATRLKVTLTARLTPSRAGEAPQRASVGVTLRR